MLIHFYLQEFRIIKSGKKLKGRLISDKKKI